MTSRPRFSTPEAVAALFQPSRRTVRQPYAPESFTGGHFYVFPLKQAATKLLPVRADQLIRGRDVPPFRTL